VSKQSKKSIPKSLRELVEKRANGQCEYCLDFEIFSHFSFHVDHIVAEQHDGTTTLDNLAYACRFCNGFKGTNLVTTLSEVDGYVPLYHPRKELWRDHFSLEVSGLIKGGSPTGKATLKLLKINRVEQIIVRSRLLEAGILLPI
jgi:5-methylcytosine-specific restriction endonuclease McrA